MYRITITTDGESTIAHGRACKLSNAKVTRAKNAHGSLTFDIYPNNPCFNALKSHKTLVKVENAKTGKVVFDGRALAANPSMDAKGIVKKSVVCEECTAYLLDSQQHSIIATEYEAAAFVEAILANHNSRVEEYKHVFVGDISVEGTYLAPIYHCSTWDLLMMAVEELGGEVRVRRGGDGLLYLDWGYQLGTLQETRIELGRNMKSVSRSTDPSGVVTRIIALGGVMYGEDGYEQRMGAGGPVDDEAAIAEFGIIEETVIWDEIKDPDELRELAREYLAGRTTLSTSTNISALDLSLIGIEPDGFDLYDWFHCVNPPIGLDEELEVVRHVIDVSNPSASTIDLGDVATTASQRLKDTYERASKGGGGADIGSIGVDTINALFAEEGES